MRIITKNCRKCGLQFNQQTRQACRPTEYCGVACQMGARRERQAASMRAAYARKKGRDLHAEERIEALDFGA